MQLFILIGKWKDFEVRRIVLFFSEVLGLGALW